MDLQGWAQRQDSQVDLQEGPQYQPWRPRRRLSRGLLYKQRRRFTKQRPPCSYVEFGQDGFWGRGDQGPLATAWPVGGRLSAGAAQQACACVVQRQEAPVGFQRAGGVRAQISFSSAPAVGAKSTGVEIYRAA